MGYKLYLNKTVIKKCIGSYFNLTFSYSPPCSFLSSYTGLPFASGPLYWLHAQKILSPDNHIAPFKSHS